ncbi:HD domain-containing protein [Vulcanisaeta thermophila]|uniref:HD domain-containing protein n=1 Tax=Vulcanisaeta thermophila TaxID=867917 RepID=UPI000852D186|nr:HD family hydrolase [Vulcanisaeta thermophila]
MSNPWNLAGIVDSILNIPRVGWVQRGVPHGIAETVGDHILLTSYLAMVMCRELMNNGVSVDLGKCLIMALIHDAHEAIVGNVGNNVRSSIPGWYEVEAAAFNSLGLPREFMDIFREYRYGASTEGLITQLADKMATLIRACLYSRRGYDVRELVVSYRDSVNKAFNALQDNVRRILRDFVDMALRCDYGTNP